MSNRITVVNKRLYFILFTGGLTAGVIFTNFFGQAYISGVGILGEYFLLNYKYTQIQYGLLFRYVFTQRVKMVFMMWLFGLTSIGIAVVCGCFIWLGFSAGVMLSVGVIKFGLKGILLCLGGVFPQFLVYIPLMAILSDRIVARIRERDRYSKKQSAAVYGLTLAAAIAAAAVGAGLETYINPGLLKKLIALIGVRG